MPEHVAGASMQVMWRSILLPGEGAMLAAFVVPGTVRIDTALFLAVTAFSGSGLPGVPRSEHGKQCDGHHCGCKASEEWSAHDRILPRRRAH